MSTVTFCDLCGVELGKGKGVYCVAITTPGERLFDPANRYDLCRKCVKPILEFKRVNPKRKMVSVETSK